MRIVPVTILLFIALLFPGAAYAKSSSITVYTYLDKRPVSATVRLVDYERGSVIESRYTNSAGYAIVSMPATGKFHVIAEVGDYLAVSERFSPADGDATIALNLFFECKKG